MPQSKKAVLNPIGFQTAFHHDELFVSFIAFNRKEDDVYVTNR